MQRCIICDTWSNNYIHDLDGDILCATCAQWPIQERFESAIHDLMERTA